MGKESAASAETPAPLPSQSAWARGPPQSSPSPQSPAPSHLYPTPSHSRRPSALVQGVPIREGVSIPRNIMGSVRQGSSLNFGSTGDASTPVSSLPTSTPVVRHESVKTFGSLPVMAATRSNIMNGKVAISASGSPTGSSEPSLRPTATVPSLSSSTSAAVSSLSASPVTTSSSVPASASNITQSTSSGTWPSTSSRPTFSVAKLFLDNSSAFQPLSDVTSPSLQPSNLPHQPSSAGQHAPQLPVQALPLSTHPYTSYGPGLRPSRGAGGSGSPAFPCALPNATDPPPQSIPGPGGSSVPANLRTPTHSHSPSSAGVSAQQHPMQPAHWPGYYNMECGSQWYHATQASYSMSHAPHSPGPTLQGPPHPNSPLSPPTQPPSLPPGTPSMAHTVPESPHTHQPSASFSISPPLPAPSTSITSGGRSLNTITTTSVPVASRPHKITIRNVDGKEVKLESLLESFKMPSLQPSTPPAPQSFPVGTGRQSALVRLEGKRAKRKWKEQARLEQQNQEAEERAKKEEEGPKRKEGGAAERREEEEKAKEGRAEMEQEEGACAEKETERQRLEEVEAETPKASAIIEPPTQELHKVEEGEVIENGEVFVTQENGASNPARKQQESLRTDTSEFTGQPPGSLDINAAKEEGSTPRPSALLTARNIDRLDEIEYPEGVRSPKTELNNNARDGKFRYDRDFLLQFMAVCREKPPNLPPLDFLTIGVFDKSSRKGSGPHCPTGPTSALGARSAPAGIGPGSFTSSGPFTMGQFGTPSTKLMSEERFLMSQSARPAFVGGGPTALLSHSALTQTPGQSGPGGPREGRHRTRSKRDKKGTDPSKAGPAQQDPGSADLGVADVDTSGVADRLVESLLNELTVEKFDSISDQIVGWANQSENEKDGRTLIQVIKLVFEKATDEANRSEMYARLCRKMMETISPKVQDDGIKNVEGKPITGGQLFRKYLLNRCQNAFEDAWAAKENAARTATAKATDDEVIKAGNEKKGDETELYSNESFASQKTKPQGLGLIKFIGELFKLQMLTERIMHECVKKLLSTAENAGEEEIESLCQLLRTVGQLLDVPKARAHMDVYFQRMRELCKNLDVSPRMQSMLLNLIELRDRKWQSPDVMNVPTTLAAVHEAAAKEKAVQEAQAFQRQFSVSYGGSKRSTEHNAEPVLDGWAVAGGSQPRLPSKAGDLSHFGKISKAAPVVMGPSSIFAGRKDIKRESITHTTSSSNVFSVLSQHPELVVEPRLSGASSQRPQNLQHLPRTTFPAPGEAPLPTPEPTAAPAAQLSGKDTKKIIDEDTKEFFSDRNLEEEDEYLTAPTS